MPIRINLLAEQQAAEEARRRDPVKRAIWLGSALTGLMVLWIISLQLQLARARAELTGYESRLQRVQEDSKEARQEWATSNEVGSRLAHLARYSTNRFFSATALDALQTLNVEDVRVVLLQTTHRYTTNAEATYKTNFVFPLATRKAWQFWKSPPEQPDILALVSNRLAAITNEVEALKSSVPLLTKISVSTNQTQATAQIEIKKPASATEHVSLTIKARDYADPPGKQVDTFFKAIANHAYFAERLQPGEGQGLRLKSRTIQPEIDPLDPASPPKPFIPFVIECRYREVARANE